MQGCWGIVGDKFNIQLRRNTKFAPGDLVLRNTRLTLTEQNKGKLSQKWEGPYIIKGEWKDGMFKLVKEDGKEYQEPDMRIISKNISNNRQVTKCL